MSGFAIPDSQPAILPASEWRTGQNPAAPEHTIATTRSGSARRGGSTLNRQNVRILALARAIRHARRNNLERAKRWIAVADRYR